MSGSLSMEGLTALCWTFTGIGLALTAGRFAIRHRLSGKSQAANYLNLLAALLLIAFVGLYSHHFPLFFGVEFAAAGLGPPVAAADVVLFFQLDLALSMLFWVIMYTIKLSFLMLYRSLFGVSPAFRRAWWGVAGFTFLTFWPCVLTSLCVCGPPRNLFSAEGCTSEEAAALATKVILFSCPLNVASDLACIALPLFMLRNLRIRPAQKLGLAALFLLGAVDVVFDVLRTAYALNGGTVALNTLWDMLEPIVAVSVCALPTYCGLLAPRAAGGGAGGKGTSAAPAAWRGPRRPRPDAYRRLLSSATSRSASAASAPEEESARAAAAGTAKAPRARRTCEVCRGRLSSPTPPTLPTPPTSPTPPTPPPKCTDAAVVDRHRRLLALARRPATIVRSTNLEVVSERVEDARAARGRATKTTPPGGGYF